MSFMMKHEALVYQDRTIYVQYCLQDYKTY